MADKKISELDAITGSNTAATDVFVVVDTSTGQTKKITREELNNAIEQDVLSSIDIDTINGDFSVNGNINLGDNNKAIFGAGSDLQIFHNAPNGNSIIKEQGGGILTFQTNGSEVSFYDTANAANMARFITGGGVQLYHNGSSRFYTSAGGVNVDGALTVSGDFTVNGTTTTINSTTLEVDDKNIVLASGAADAAAANGSGITIDGASATFTYVSSGDKWQLNKPLDVTGGITSTALSQFTDVNIPDNNAIRFGNSQDLQIYHDGTYNFINAASGQFIFMQADELRFRSTTGETYFASTLNAATSLYYDASLKLTTTSTGIDVTGGVDITSGTTTGLVINHDTFANGLKIIRNDSNNAPSITFENTSGRIGILYANDADNEPVWRRGTDATNYRIFHTGNDGSGSGLDADTVDGLQASNFLRSDAFDISASGLYLQGGSYDAGTDTATAPLIIDEGDYIYTKDGTYLRKLIGKTASSDTIEIGQSGTGLISLINLLPGNAGNSAVKVHGNTVWNAGNDGSGSGLDADTVDGVDSLSFKRNDQTGVTAEFSQWYSTSSHVYSNNVNTYYWIHLGTMGGASKGSIEYEFKTDENYPHFVKGTIAFSSFSGGSSFGVQHDQHSPDRFAVQVRLDTSRRIWIRAPGVSWAHFFRFRTHHATGSFTTNTSFSVGTGKLTSVPANSSSDINGGHNLRASNTSVTGSVPTYTDNYHRFPNIAVHHNVTIAGNTAWHGGNDGSGSGLDADTVDGIQASSFLRSDATDTMTGQLNMENDIDIAFGNASATRFLKLPRGGGITMYGDGSTHHGIFSRNEANSVTDDILISSYNGVHIDLDSNNNNNSGSNFTIGKHNSTSIQFTFNGETSDLTVSGNVTAYSDERLKDNIETLDGSKVYEMRGVSFTKEGKAGSGVIAQELKTVAPELVIEDGEYLSVAYGNVVGYLIEAIKELKAEVDDLKTQLAEKG